MVFQDSSLLIAAGASFVAGVMGYIIARFWVKPIAKYKLTRRRLDANLTRYLNQSAGSSDALQSNNKPASDQTCLRSARKQAMDLVSIYTAEIPYWYRLLLDSRQAAPTNVSGLLANVHKIQDPQQRRSRIEAVKKELKLHGK